jgi:organic radical activating enzyme
MPATKIEGAADHEKAAQASPSVSVLQPCPRRHPYRFVVLTGGEPLLQIDDQLIEALHRRGFVIAVETNVTIDPPSGLDWICVSPKAGGELRVRSGHELKLVFPQPGAPPEAFEDLAFERFSLQPMHGPKLGENTALAIDYCLRNPRWRLSVQVHKLVNIR